ncbi:winged helix-turn-helix domain-containing protein [Deinococcus metallilatus]|uniref:Transposase n=1 Tax=Deinococcus metallilatus TaxID=1211322 RepID=A0ABR6MSZ1_9DEIO|nr:winged helix-turn-helix domain-containing protein [Deinococcus metallilatus]MBB5294804.1 transposase [Deinococcus metallilatus]GMA16730.1 hypothetical protein GCM10025871_30610 [Deinococcus metallilatus]
MPIQFQHSAAEFWAIYRASTCAVERRRAQFFALRYEGKSEADTLELTKYSASAARLIIQRYHKLGLAGLRDGRPLNQGAPTLLTAAEQQELAAQLREALDQGRPWDGPKVQAWLKERLGKTVHIARTYELMRAAGFSLQQPRPRHVKSDKAAKEAFRAVRESWPSKLSVHCPLAPVNVTCCPSQCRVNGP